MQGSLPSSRDPPQAQPGPLRSELASMQAKYRGQATPVPRLAGTHTVDQTVQSGQDAALRAPRRGAAGGREHHAVPVGTRTADVADRDVELPRERDPGHAEIVDRDGAAAEQCVATTGPVDDAVERVDDTLAIGDVV